MTPSSEESTKVDIHLHEFLRGPGPENSSKLIETPGYIVSLVLALNGPATDHTEQVVLDERKDTPLETQSPLGFELTLDVFHFLRRCPQHPADIPEPCEVALPLAPLRQCLVEALARHRVEHWPRKRKAEADQEGAVRSPLPLQGDQALEESAAVRKAREWKQQKKNNPR